MIIRDSNSSRVPPCSARESRLPLSMGSRDELTHAIGCHGPVGSQLRHELRENLSDQLADGTGRIFTQIEVNGRVGLFEFFAFHEALNSQREQEDNAARN